MTKRAKSPVRRVPPRAERGVTFGEALREMRAQAQEGVSEAIVAATLLKPPPRAKGTPRISQGHQVQALFDGICEALADTIVDVARPGGEEQMAKLVGDILMQKVRRRGCAGSA
jgi:hypothetical protein